MHGPSRSTTIAALLVSVPLSGTELAMLSSLPKRPASVSPEPNRPNKRLATSSPEEGELDDGSPPPPPIARSPSPPRPAKKVPFPFKKKAAAPENGASANGSSGGPSNERERAYERDEERRYGDDPHRRFGLPPRPDDRPPRGGVWGPERYERPRWESQSYVPDYREPEQRRPYRSPSPPPRHSDRRRPSSRSRSRSPSSPRSPLTPSSGKEKHRLPPPRPIVPDPETYRAVYERERWKEEEERYGRRRDSYDDLDGRREGEHPSL